MKKYNRKRFSSNKKVFYKKCKETSNYWSNKKEKHNKKNKIKKMNFK